MFTYKIINLLYFQKMLNLLNYSLKIHKDLLIYFFKYIKTSKLVSFILI